MINIKNWEQTAVGNLESSGTKTIIKVLKKNKWYFRQLLSFLADTENKMLLLNGGQHSISPGVLKIYSSDISKYLNVSVKIIECLHVIMNFAGQASDS